jgi:hypothetical protein
MTLKNHFHQVLVLFWIPLTIGGCGYTQHESGWPFEIRRDLEARFKQLELKIGASKAEWSRNEPIIVSAYLTNKGPRGMIDTDIQPWAIYQMAVVDADHRPVPVDRSLAKQFNRGAVSAKTREVKPGETIEDEIRLSDHFVMNRKGIYLIMVQRQVGPRGIAEQLLISNTITISVND